MHMEQSQREVEKTDGARVAERKGGKHANKGKKPLINCKKQKELLVFFVH